VIHFWR